VRFDDYCRRKTAEAAQATIPGCRTVGETSIAAPLAPIGNEWSRRLFDGDFYRSEPIRACQRPAISLVFVESRDGNTEAEEPSTLGGGDTDKHLVYEGLSRVDADAVLAGATTASAEELVFSVWHPELVRLREQRGHPRHPVQIVPRSKRGAAHHTCARQPIWHSPTKKVLTGRGP